MNLQKEAMDSAKEGVVLYASTWGVGLVLGFLKIAPVVVVTAIDASDILALVLGILGTGFVFRWIRRTILKG